jgi:hypothetical protein
MADQLLPAAFKTTRASFRGCTLHGVAPTLETARASTGLCAGYESVSELLTNASHLNLESTDYAFSHDPLQFNRLVRGDPRVALACGC